MKDATGFRESEHPALLQGGCMCRKLVARMAETTAFHDRGIGGHHSHRETASRPKPFARPLGIILGHYTIPAVTAPLSNFCVVFDMREREREREKPPWIGLGASWRFVFVFVLDRIEASWIGLRIGRIGDEVPMNHNDYSIQTPRSTPRRQSEIQVWSMALDTQRQGCTGVGVDPWVICQG
jgi:hypothetical protein